MEHDTNTITQPIDHSGKIFRKLATPLTIGFFTLTASTGSLLFLDVHLGMLKHVHEWASILFVLFCGLHVVINWRQMQRHLSQPQTKVILTIVVLLMCVSLLPIADTEHKKHGERWHYSLSSSAAQIPDQQEHYQDEEHGHR